MTVRQDNSKLKQCISASCVLDDIDEVELAAFVERRYREAGMGDVTGVVLYKDGSFLHILEGPEDMVDAMYKTISADPLQANTVKIIEEAIDHREFPDMTASYHEAAKAVLPGLSSGRFPFSSDTSYAHLPNGRARTLIAQFLDGRWRRRA